MSFLDREATVAPLNYNRWLVPPAALAIHMCIGQVYGFSVFKIPLTHLLGISKELKGQDWNQEQIAWVFSIAIAVLGLAAAFLGTWAERNGPRKVSFIAAFCFGGGFLVSAVGVHLHSILLDLSRIWVARRHRTGVGLHRAGEHPGKMVSRPAGPGDGHGDHGFRRRRAGRLAVSRTS